MKLRTLGLTVLGTLGLTLPVACQKEAASPTPAAPAAPAPAAPAAAPPAIKAEHLPEDVPVPADDADEAPKGGGTIQGVVSFKGTPPPPNPIEPGTDPNCDGMDLVDQPVLAKAGKLANVLVRVQGAVPGQPALSPEQMVVVDQNRCTYKPHVQGAVKGQPIVLMNSDSTLHNVRGTAAGKQLFNVTQPPLKTKEARPPSDAEVIRLKCDIHPWMTAWVVVGPNPYFNTTDEAGAFRIEGVPPGTYTLEAWHESLGTRTAQVTVKEGQAATASFEFAAAK